MGILILGGTQMLGKDFVITANDCGYSTTIANRGLTQHNLPKTIKHLKIDRNSKHLCAGLYNGVLYDCVIDFSCYNTNDFLNTIDYIRCKKYILISTTSVKDTASIEVSNNPYLQYAIFKKNLETYISNHIFDFPIIIVRPCAVYGFDDYTKRFEYRDGDFYWIKTNKKAKESNNCIDVKFLTASLLELIQLNDYPTNIIEVRKNIKYV